MNKDKIIKDLKEKNRKLKNLYELQEVRLHNLQYQIDKLSEELEITQNKWKKDKQFYKHRFEDYIEYKNRINKAIKYIEDFKKVYKEEVYIPLEEVLNILRGENNEI